MENNTSGYVIEKNESDCNLDELLYNMNTGERLIPAMRWGIRHEYLCVIGGWICQPIFREFNGKDEYLPATFIPHPAISKALNNK